jgi:hypothetical protein
LDESIGLSKLEGLICEIALFYKGSAPIPWLQKLPYSRLVSLHNQAVRINKEISKNV